MYGKEKEQVSKIEITEERDAQILRIKERQAEKSERILYCKSEREKERDRNRDKQRQRQRQIDIYIQRQIDRQRERERERERETDRHNQR